MSGFDRANIGKVYQESNDTLNVGSYSIGMNRAGISDLIGNVYEYVEGELFEY